MLGASETPALLMSIGAEEGFQGFELAGFADGDEVPHPHSRKSSGTGFGMTLANIPAQGAGLGSG